MESRATASATRFTIQCQALKTQRHIKQYVSEQIKAKCQNDEKHIIGWHRLFVHAMTLFIISSFTIVSIEIIINMIYVLVANSFFFLSLK